MPSYPFLGGNLEVLQRVNPSFHHWLLIRSHPEASTD